MRRTLFLFSTATAGIGTAALPWLLLAIRLWLAQAYLTALVMMMMSGGSLAATLSPGWWVGIIESVAASGLGHAVQALCPLLLAAGLFGRPSAIALLLQLALFGHLSHPSPMALLDISALAGLICFGPGPLSLDRLAKAGIPDSPLPGVHAAALLYAWLTRRGVVIWLVALRIGIAAALVFAVRPATDLMGGMPEAGRLVLACMVLLGLGARPAALLLMTAVLADPVTGQGGFDTLLLLLLGLLAACGGGPIAFDRRLSDWLRRRTTPVASALHHVVVVGGGFGGMAAVQSLRAAPCRITLVDKRNHHLFQPLLYQVATAGLSPADIASPIRAILRQQDNVRVLLREVVGVDTIGKTVDFGTLRLSYDTLILATGAQHGYFGRDSWSAFAPGLKTLEDATDIRRRILSAFEAAENTDDPIERASWLTFAIIGGGPTGVELAGAIVELARHGMTGEFQLSDPATARVLLVQSASRVLPTFPLDLSQAAARLLSGLGVELLLDSRVEDVDARGVTIAGVLVPARTVIWAAGVMASPAAEWLGAKTDRAGRTKVGRDLRAPGQEDVFVIGDTAACPAWNGSDVPGLAPAAKQQGVYVARVVTRRLLHRGAPPPFVYRHRGSLATIGRKAAVADFGRLKLKGAIAWWLWGGAHIIFLVDARSRAGVCLSWIWNYATFKRSTRLIVGRQTSDAPSK